MCLVIFHLSDLHITDSSELKQEQSIVACLREFTDLVTDVGIIISGDIAFSGSISEYDKAKLFIENIKSNIEKEIGMIPSIIFIPGNHDCFLNGDTSVRDLIIENIRSQHGICNSIEMMRHCLSAQNNFFNWAKNYMVIPELEERICWKMEVPLQTKRKVVFLCLNTAWMSTLNESQGKLYFPIDKIPEISSADIVISIFHHPYNWLNSDNARSLRQLLEENSDLIVSGHEHESEIYRKDMQSGFSVEYIEGDVFHNSENYSGFHLIAINPDSDLFQLRHYAWENTYFKLTTRYNADWSPFIRNSIRSSRAYGVSDEMLKYLRDPGVQLTHRAKDIELEDIFIPPNLRRFTGYSPKKGFTYETIDSDYVINHIFKDKNIYFIGDGQCGKTTLAKMLFSHAYRRGLTPIFIKGEKLNHYKSDKLQRIISSEFKKQYKYMTYNEYLQQSKENKVIIIDDFHNSILNRQYKRILINQLNQDYEYIFIFGAEFSQIEENLSDIETGGSLSNLKYFEIMDFGYFLRERLIEKWLSLGKDHLIDKENLAQQVSQVGFLIQSVIRKNLLPCNPIFILVMLQQLEAGQEINTRAGSYGYFYDFLINNALIKTSSSMGDIDLKCTYLADLAWHLFNENRWELSYDELEIFNASHWNKYRLTGFSEDLISQFSQSKILIIQDNLYSFHYKYLFYYFVARYMHDNINDPDVINVLDLFVSNLHREDYANIIIFLSYLTRDRSIFNKILIAAREIFPEVSPCNLEDHVDFLNKLQETLPLILLHDGDPIERRRTVLRQMDIEEEQKRPIGKNNNKIEEIDHQEGEIEGILLLNRAYKSMQIMGQILRNFSGSLRGDLKLQIVEECFNLGLRSLNSIYHILEKNLDSVIDYFADVLGENLREMLPDQRIESAKSIIFFLTIMFTLNSINKISYAIGSKQLMPTYDDMDNSCQNTAAHKLVQIEIRMDHANSFPEHRITEMIKAYETNIFCRTLLNLLVANHFYLFPRSHRTRQKICKLLGIAPTKKMIVGYSTRLPKLK